MRSHPVSPSPWAVSNSGRILCPFGCGGFVSDSELNLLRLLRSDHDEVGAQPTSYYARAREWRVPCAARFASLVAIRSDKELTAAFEGSASADLDGTLTTPGRLELLCSGEVRFDRRVVALCALGSVAVRFNQTVLKIRPLQGGTAQVSVIYLPLHFIRILLTI